MSLKPLRCGWCWGVRKDIEEERRENRLKVGQNNQKTEEKEVTATLVTLALLIMCQALCWAQSLERKTWPFGNRASWVMATVDIEKRLRPWRECGACERLRESGHRRTGSAGIDSSKGEVESPAVSHL